jgi:hypothetical protein
MEPAKEPTKPLSSIYKSSVVHNKTTGMNGSHLHSTSRTLSHQQQQRKCHLTYLLDTPHKFTNQPEKPTSPY